jgi:hypothetical protein
MNKSVHIFCLREEICVLIKKSLLDSSYDVSCTNTANVDKSFLNKFKNEPDCIILDKNIEQDIKLIILEHFKNKPIICLPSLEGEYSENPEIRYISEPLKPSELTKTLEDIFSVA